MDERLLDNDREWREFIIGKLETIEEKVTDSRIEIAQLKTKAAVWGAVAGAVPVAIFAVIQLFGFLNQHFNGGSK